LEQCRNAPLCPGQSGNELPLQPFLWNDDPRISGINYQILDMLYFFKARWTSSLTQMAATQYFLNV
jgi:hypothetical protein